MILSSSSEAEVHRMQKFMTANGIRTYIKNEDVRRFHRLGTQWSGLVDPSLHVIDSNDYKKAIELIQSQQKKIENNSHERNR
jgi:hypothetical protein